MQTDNTINQKEHSGQKKSASEKSINQHLKMRKKTMIAENV